MSTSIYEELLTAISKKAAEDAKEKSFTVTTTGGLDHFLTCEEKPSTGLYIGTVPHEGNNFKVYMV